MAAVGALRDAAALAPQESEIWNDLGLAWQAAGRGVATVQFDMQFVSAARMGDFVETRPEVVRRTAALVFMRGTLLAGTRVVATAQGVWKILG